MALYCLRTSQSNHSCSQLEAFLLSFQCEKNLILHLRIPAAKCRSLSSRLLLAKRRGPSIWWWLTVRSVIAVWPSFRRPVTQWWSRSQPAAVLFILTHSHRGELAPATSQMFVQCCALWPGTKPNFKVLFCSLTLLLWQLLLWIHRPTCVPLFCLLSHYSTVAANKVDWLKCWLSSWLRRWQYCRLDSELVLNNSIR